MLPCLAFRLEACSLNPLSAKLSPADQSSNLAWVRGPIPGACIHRSDPTWGSALARDSRIESARPCPMAGRARSWRRFMASIGVPRGGSRRKTPGSIRRKGAALSRDAVSKRPMHSPRIPQGTGTGFVVEGMPTGPVEPPSVRRHAPQFQRISWRSRWRWPAGAPCPRDARGSGAPGPERRSTPAPGWPGIRAPAGPHRRDG